MEDLESPLNLALELCAELAAPLKSLKWSAGWSSVPRRPADSHVTRSFLLLSELRYLQGDRSTALTFWMECADK